MSAQSNSPYARGRRHFYTMLAALPLLVWVIPTLLVSLGASFEASGMVVFLTLPLGLWALLIRCPQCGKSVFMRGIWSMPWPARRCSKCGNDLTI